MGLALPHLDAYVPLLSSGEVEPDRADTQRQQTQAEDALFEALSVLLSQWPEDRIPQDLIVLSALLEERKDLPPDRCHEVWPVQNPAVSRPA